MTLTFGVSTAAELTASDISEQEPFIAMARMGLSLYQEPENTA